MTLLQNAPHTHLDVQNMPTITALSLTTPLVMHSLMEVHSTKRWVTRQESDSESMRCTRRRDEEAEEEEEDEAAAGTAMYVNCNS